jgi:glutathione S-transferase
MTYVLHIGDRAYSSWSLRAWLMFDAFGLPVRTCDVPLYDERKAGALAALAPARLVPVLDLPDGTRVADTLAIAETLAERHSGAGLWPDEPAARATARWLAAEMHAGFTALRGACPMNLRRRYAGFVPNEAVRADLSRLQSLWSLALDHHGGPWLFGRYTLADVFYAPVAVRVAGYGLPVSDAASAYVARQLAHPSLARWHAASTEGPEAYALDLPSEAWRPAA